MWTAAAHLPHHMSRSLPASSADVLVEGDVEMRGRLVVLDHVKEGRRSLQVCVCVGWGGEEKSIGINCFFHFKMSSTKWQGLTKKKKHNFSLKKAGKLCCHQSPHVTLIGVGTKGGFDL